MSDEVRPEDVDTQPMDVVDIPTQPLAVVDSNVAPLRNPPPPCSTCG